MRYLLCQTNECGICHVQVPAHQFDDHYYGHFARRKKITSQPAAAPGEPTARLADPNVPADDRTVVLP